MLMKIIKLWLKQISKLILPNMKNVCLPPWGNDMFRWWCKLLPNISIPWRATKQLIYKSETNYEYTIINTNIKRK